MENYTIKGKFGKITITEKAIKKAIVGVLNNIEEKIVFTDNKWRPAKRGAKSLDVCETNHIEVTSAADGICVELYIKIRGDNTANNITDEIVSKIDKSLVSLMGEETSSITLNIQKNTTKIPFNQ